MHVKCSPNQAGVHLLMHTCVLMLAFYVNGIIMKYLLKTMSLLKLNTDILKLTKILCKNRKSIIKFHKSIIMISNIMEIERLAFK